MAVIVFNGNVGIPNNQIVINSVGSLTVNDDFTQNNTSSSVGVNVVSDGTVMVTSTGSGGNSVRASRQATWATSLRFTPFFYILYQCSDECSAKLPSPAVACFQVIFTFQSMPSAGHVEGFEFCHNFLPCAGGNGYSKMVPYLLNDL